MTRVQRFHEDTIDRLGRLMSGHVTLAPHLRTNHLIYWLDEGGWAGA